MKVTWITIALLSIVNMSSCQESDQSQQPQQPQQQPASPTAGISGPTNSPSAVLSSPTLPSATSSAIEPPSLPTSIPQGPPILCSDQTVFELCLKNQDNYIKGCKADEYACYCRWQTSKLSCYDNCPQDSGITVQRKEVKDACSKPGANVTLPAQTWIPPTSSLLPTATGIAPSSVSPATDNNHKSSANQLSPIPSHHKDMCFLALILVIAGLMF